jgi:hypothetical protein
VLLAQDGELRVCRIVAAPIPWLTYLDAIPCGGVTVHPAVVAVDDRFARATR